MEFLHRNPFVRLLLPLVIGILMSEYCEITDTVLVALAACTVFFLVLPVVLRRTKVYYRLLWMHGCAIMLFFLAFGAWLGCAHYQALDVDCLGEECIFRAEIVDAPEEKERTYLCRSRVTHVSDSAVIRSEEADVLLYVTKDSASMELKRGDVLLFSTKLAKPVNFADPTQFDSVDYLRKQGIAATGYVRHDKWKLLGHDDSFSLLGLAEKCQHRLLAVYQKYGIEGDAFGVLAALTLGHRESLEPELRSSFSDSGAMHILAVSGLHVGIVFWVFGLFLRLVRCPKVLKTFLLILLLWGYAFITGLSPSVMRATIMFSIFALGESVRAESQVYNRIAFSAFVLLVYDPMLLFNVGFRLSYSAVVAIVYFQPKIAGLVYVKWRLLRWLWELTSVSIAAQLGVLPWLLLYFEQFANYFLLTNLLAIPMASLIIYTALLLFFSSLFSPLAVVTQWVSCLLEGEVEFLNRCVRMVSTLPHAVTVWHISSLQAFLIFAVLVFSALCVTKMKPIWLYSALCSVFLFLALGWYGLYVDRQTSRLLVYADSRQDRVEMIVSGDTLCLPDTAVLANNAFTFAGECYFVLCSDTLRFMNTGKVLEVDHLILGDVGSMPCDDLFELIHAHHVWALPTMPYWCLDELKQYCIEHGMLLCDLRAVGTQSKVAHTITHTHHTPTSNYQPTKHSQ